MKKLSIDIGLSKLISQSQVSKSNKAWHRTVFNDIEARLNNVDFPCIFSKRAFRKSLLKFIFVENDSEKNINYLAAGLQEYVEISRGWDGNLSTAYPLIIAFSQVATNAITLKDYHSFGWKILQKLHDLDPQPWPTQVGQDPNAQAWSMCFNGMPLFCNMSTPANQVRQSRNLGEHFILVINPRERFDIVAGDTPAGRKVRDNIRTRISRYDGIPHALQLGSYSTGALEWWQYGLVDENIERKDQCPFIFKKNDPS